MFAEALFLIARTWKQPRCPPADEWIKRCIQWNITHHKKRNETGSFVVLWSEPSACIQWNITHHKKRNETGSFVVLVIRSEASQKEKNKYHIIMYICGT